MIKLRTVIIFLLSALFLLLNISVAFGDDSDNQ